MGFQFDFLFFLYEIKVGVGFIPIVLLLSLLPLLVGMAIGSVIAIIRLFRVPFLAPLLAGIVVFLRGVPLLLQLSVLYLLTNIVFDKLHIGGLSAKDVSYTGVAVLGLSIYATVYLSEVIRTALQSVGRGQYEAAFSIGMTKRQMIRRILLPQALPVALPLLGSNLIGLIKNSSVASLISVVELLNGTQFEASGNYKFLEAYLASALLYWVLCFLVERGIAFLETRSMHYEKGELS